VTAAKAVGDKPSFIKVTTLIGYGSPNKSDSHDVHGAPLGAEETVATRANLNWKHDAFVVPENVMTNMDCSAKAGPHTSHFFLLDSWNPLELSHFIT